MPDSTSSAGGKNKRSREAPVTTHSPPGLTVSPSGRSPSTQGRPQRAPRAQDAPQRGARQQLPVQEHRTLSEPIFIISLREMRAVPSLRMQEGRGEDARWRIQGKSLSGKLGHGVEDISQKPEPAPGWSGKHETCSGSSEAQRHVHGTCGRKMGAKETLARGLLSW